MTNRTNQRMIHVACKQLGLDDDTRRDLQLQVTGKASMADMTDAELVAVISALKAKGFKSTSGVPKGSLTGRAPARRADIRYIHVLWGLLGANGALTNPSRKGLNAFMREGFHKKWGAVPLDIDMLSDTAQIRAVTEALKAMAKRAGIEVRK
jgi:phage gp16-like protein